MQNFNNDIPCVYFCASGKGFILDVNDILCNSLGYTKEELIGKKLEDIFTLSTRIFQQTHFYPLLQLKGNAEEIYITLKSRNGEEVPLLTNAVRKEDNGNIIIHFAGITVNKRKKFEDEIIAAKKAAEKALQENTALKNAQSELQHRAEELDIQIGLANLQNQELKQFSHVATHTLQEPLRKILVFSSQLTASEQHSEGSAVQKISKAAKDMHAKLQGLQQYVWLTNEHIEWNEVDLNSIIDIALKKIESENPVITITLSAELLPVIQGNKEQLLFLFTELFTNAVKFRKEKNEVSIRITSINILLNKFRQIPEKYKYSEFVKIQVKDSGLGFDNEYQLQAFELFRKLHLTSGQGIGLSLCKKIVESHGGSVSIESKTNAGTEVVILLPLSPV